MIPRVDYKRTGACSATSAGFLRSGQWSGLTPPGPCDTNRLLNSVRRIPMRKTSLLVLAVLALIVIPVCKKAPTMKYPVTAKVEQVDDYFGTASGRSLPLAGGRHVRRDRGLGQGPERGHLRLPGEDPLPRGPQEAADRHLQLPPLLVALPGRGALLLRQERRPAEPVRHLRPEGPGRRARGVHRPQRPLGRRHHSDRPDRPLRRQEAHGRLARRGRLGLVRDPGHGHRRQEGAGRLRSSGSSSPARPGGRTASSTAATTSPRPARS